MIEGFTGIGIAAQLRRVPRAKPCCPALFCCGAPSKVLYKFAAAFKIRFNVSANINKKP
jgi:hypothetical protein